MNTRKKYILSLDLGSSAAGAVLFSREGQVVKQLQKEYEKYYPEPGWIEVDPNEIWFTMLSVMEELVASAGIAAGEIAGIGIANQRETTVVWDRKTGEPIAPAIVWQDRRTAAYCEALRAAGKAKMICDATGLELDAYFSATKIKWLPDHVPGARERARKGALCSAPSTAGSHGNCAASTSPTCRTLRAPCCSIST